MCFYVIHAITCNKVPRVYNQILSDLFYVVIVVVVVVVFC